MFSDILLNHVGHLEIWYICKQISVTDLRNVIPSNEYSMRRWRNIFSSVVNRVSIWLLGWVEWFTVVEFGLAAAAYESLAVVEQASTTANDSYAAAASPNSTTVNQSTQPRSQSRTLRAKDGNQSEIIQVLKAQNESLQDQINTLSSRITELLGLLKALTKSTQDTSQESGVRSPLFSTTRKGYSTFCQ